MNETIEQRATRIVEYSKLGFGQNRAEMDLREAEHQGWMRGWDDRSEMAEAHWKRLWPMVFLCGFGCGVLFIAMFLRV